MMMTRPPKLPSGSSSNNRSSWRPTLLHLLFAAAIFSIIVFTIQSSLFTGCLFIPTICSPNYYYGVVFLSSSFFRIEAIWKFYFKKKTNLFEFTLLRTDDIIFVAGDRGVNVINREEIRILSDFQSSLQQCVVGCRYF